MNLLYKFYEAPSDHPRIVMRRLGITYEHVTPPSTGTSWSFWNCSNVPDPLPPFLQPLTVAPMDAVGYEPSREVAAQLVRNAAAPDTQP